MRIIRRSDTSGRITEFVKEDGARINIKVTPSLQYTDGIELRGSIDDTATAIVYLRLDDLRVIIDFIRHQGTAQQKVLLATHELSNAKRQREKPAKDTGRLLPKMPLPEHLRRKD